MKLIRLLKRELSMEAASWIRKGIISSDQAIRILEIYGAKLPEPGEKSRAYYVLLTIAFLLMGLGLIVLISANWEEIPRAVRMVSLILLTLIINTTGAFFFRTGNHPAAQIWLFFGGLVYGATIFLIAQIYHLGEHFPDGVLYWALGVMPVGLIVQGHVLMILASVLSLLWLYLESVYGGFPYMYLLFACGIFWFCFHQRRSLLIFLLGIMGLVFWSEVLVMYTWIPGHYGFEFGEEHIYFTVVVFIFLHLAGSIMDKYGATPRVSDYGLILKLWTMRFALVMLFIFSFEGPWQELCEHPAVNRYFVLGCVLASLFGLPLALGIMSRFAPSHQNSHPWSFRSLSIDHIPVMGFSVFFSICSMIILLVPNHQWETKAVGLQILTNLCLLITGIWFILSAYKTYASSTFHLGVGVILLTALFRYFDLIGDYIGGAVLFFIAGCIMLITARLWKRHMKGRPQ